VEASGKGIKEKAQCGQKAASSRQNLTNYYLWLWVAWEATERRYMLVSFQGQNKAVSQGSKVLRKNTTEQRECGDFLPNPEGLTLKPKKGKAITSPLRNGDRHTARRNR